MATTTVTTAASMATAAGVVAVPLAALRVTTAAATIVTAISPRIALAALPVVRAAAITPLRWRRLTAAARGTGV